MVSRKRGRIYECEQDKLYGEVHLQGPEREERVGGVGWLSIRRIALLILRS